MLCFTSVSYIFNIEEIIQTMDVSFSLQLSMLLLSFIAFLIVHLFYSCL